jgi:hypothetical protein
MRGLGIDSQRTASIAVLCLYALLGLLAVLLPLVFWMLELPIISYTYEKAHQPFELFGFFASIALMTGAYIELKKRSRTPLIRLFPIILPIFVSFYYLIFISEYSLKSNDYIVYQEAAKAIVRGDNPYENAYVYLYPPTTAQVMAWLYRLGQVGASVVQVDMNPDRIWNLVFYFYQCSQFLLIILAYFLCYRFGRSAGLQSIPASVLVTTLLLLNNPLVRTLRHNQVNLWLLDLILVAILFTYRYPSISGLAVALGGHVKLYPLILWLPWAITKRWRAIFASIVGLLFIAFIQTDWGKDWQLWSQFLTSFSSFPESKVSYFRNNNLYGIIYNAFAMVGFMRNVDVSTMLPGISMVSNAVKLAIIVWFAVRFINRERAFRKLVNASDNQVIDRSENTFRFFGHAMDALALGLLISPSVWEHHYVLAIPIVIWAGATVGRSKPWQIAIGAFLMFALPTFDVFPLSYHRMVGLVLVLYFTSPWALYQSRISTETVTQDQGNASSDLKQPRWI